MSKIIKASKIISLAAICALLAQSAQAGAATQRNQKSNTANQQVGAQYNDALWEGNTLLSSQGQSASAAEQSDRNYNLQPVVKGNGSNELSYTGPANQSPRETQKSQVAPQNQPQRSNQKAAAADSSNSVKIHGSTAVAANILKPSKNEIERQSQAALNIVTNGENKGVQDLINGKADIAMTASSIDQIRASNSDPRINQLRATQIGTARISVIANRNNTVAELSNDQLRSILSGQTTNWSQLGGKNEPITIVTECSDSNTCSAVQQQANKGEAISGKTKQANNEAQIISIVAENPGAIGFASEAATKSANNSIKNISTSQSIEQPLWLLTNGNPSPAQQRIIDAAAKAKNAQ